MRLTQRAYNGEADLRVMAELVHASPGSHLHVVDLPYRFSSWAFDDPQNIRLWFDSDDVLQGWGALQTPFWAIDIGVRPQDNYGLYREILAWANRRAEEALETASGRPAWYVNVFAGQLDRIGDLEAAGFTSQAHAGDNAWSKVLMVHSGAVTVAARVLAAGFSIRPLAGEGEAAAYVDLHRAVFQSNSMTVEWRRRTLRRTEYMPDLDLVASAPDGRLAAFCIGWLSTQPGQTRSGQIEPLGVHGDFRNLGLGRAILTECLRRLSTVGAQRIYVETDNYRDAALKLYEDVGFSVLQDVLVFRKDYARVPGKR